MDNNGSGIAANGPLTLIRSVPADSDTVDVAIDSEAGLILSTSRTQGTLTIATIDESVAPIRLAVGSSASSIKVLNQRREALILSDSGSEVSVVDLTQRKLSGAISLGSAIARSSDSVNRLLVASDERRAYVVGVGRLQTSAGSELSVANLVTVDVEQRSVISTVPLDATESSSIDVVPHGSWLEESQALIVSSYGRRSEGGVIAHGLLQDESVLAGIGRPGARCVAVDGPLSRMYVGYQDWVMIGSFATSDRMVSMGLGGQVPYPLPFQATKYYSRGAPCAMAVDLATRRLYVANAGRAALGVMDLDSGTFVGATQLESVPWGIALDTKRGLLAVAMRDQAEVALYQIASP